MTKLIPVKKLKQWRARARKTQAECAGAVGTYREVWSDWERGRRIPSREFMPKVLALTGGEVVAGDFYPQIEEAA